MSATDGRRQQDVKNPASERWPESDGIDRVLLALERSLDGLMARLKTDSKPTANGSTAKLVLIALARRAGNDDYTTAGWDHIAAFVSVRRDAVGQSLKALEAGGLIIKEDRPGDTSRIWLDWDAISALPTVVERARELRDKRKGRAGVSENPTPPGVGKPDTPRCRKTRHPPVSENPTPPVGKPDTLSRRIRHPVSENPTRSQNPGEGNGEKTQGANRAGVYRGDGTGVDLATRIARLLAARVGTPEDAELIVSVIDNADGEPPHDVLEDLLGASGFFDDRAAEVLVFFRPWRILDAVRAVEKRVADGEPIHSFRAQVATYLSQNCNEDHLRMGEVRAEPERFQRLIVALTPESKKRRQRA